MTTNPEPVTIIGGGGWGTALAQLAADAGCGVTLWMRDRERAETLNRTRRNERYWPEYALNEKVRATASLEEAAASAKLMLIVLPSHAVREVTAALGAYIFGDHIIIHASKGIEQGTHKRMTEIIREETPARRIGVLSGPNLAGEIMLGLPAATVVASRFPEVVQRAQAALMSPRFRVYGSGDPLGVEYAGASKNVIAVCAGMLHGLELGANALSMLMTRGEAEIRRFGVAMGADVTTFAGLAGIGDLIGTCFSTLSKNFHVGYRLSRGDKIEDIMESLNGTAEGVGAAKAIYEISRKKKIEMPITRGAHALLYEGAAPDALLRLLMARSPKYEMDSYYHEIDDTLG